MQKGAPLLGNYISRISIQCTWTLNGAGVRLVAGQPGRGRLLAFSLVSPILRDNSEIVMS
jgi:hypothetical protein